MQQSRLGSDTDVEEIGYKVSKCEWTELEPGPNG